MDAFLGSWKLDHSEGFDEVMSRLGVNFVTRKAGNTLKPTVTVTKEGDHYKMVTASTFKTCQFEFKLGEPFEETTLDGRKVTSTVTLEGDVMKQVQVGDKTTEIERRIDGDHMKTTVKVDELKCHRDYKKI
uniref:Fatty acid-binding protein homolog 1 n=1 Tax=Schistocephalus solidus TaxID=70667 RepID=A0A0X3PUC2_SCHSO